MVAGQRTPSCRLGALGDSPKCLILLLKHTSVVAKADLQTADFHSPKPAAAPLGCGRTYWKSTTLNLKFLKDLCPGNAWVLFNLVGT